MTKLWEDPIVAEVRKIRAAISREMVRDPEGYKARIEAQREQYKDRVVHLKPRRIKATAKVAQ